MNESDSHILSKATHLLALSALTLASTLCLAELPSRQPSNSTLPGRKVAEVSHVTETNGSNYFTAPVSKSEESKALISTNFVDLSKGAANLDAQFFSTEYIAPELYVSSTSTEEKRKKLNDNKVSVSRTYMGIGATGYIWGTKANKNIFISGNLS